ncbi:MAG: hypothetical protein PHD07_08655 [Bacteroidales bacterium]|nr:hypothetical protein [Bacteroidales bacterium]MDD3201954.1 hypothetical protein [Bacteroidales bacterium]
MKMFCGSVKGFVDIGQVGSITAGSKFQIFGVKSVKGLVQPLIVRGA